MIKQLQHVAVRVTDLNRARAFYEGVLGCEPSVNRPSLSVTGMWYEWGSVQLHLLASSEALCHSPLSHPGHEPHIAFGVTDIELVKRVLQQADIPFVESRSGRKALFCRDPDGNVLELAEF